jgi:hypothetical protein
MTPFDFIKDILTDKNNLLKDDESLTKEYAPFIVNRGLSFHLNCVLCVNEMNRWPNLDRDMQYQYLLNTIRTEKRKFQPWQKMDVNRDIECVKWYFGYSNEKAKDALRILSVEQINEIKNKMEKGGAKNTKTI